MTQKQKASKTFTITVTAKQEPLYLLPSDDQMFLTPDGKLFVVYDDDHDEDPNLLHDVTHKYDVKVEKSEAAN